LYFLYDIIIEEKSKKEIKVNNFFWHKKYGFIDIKQIEESVIIFSPISLKQTDKSIYFNKYIYTEDKKNFYMETFSDIDSFVFSLNEEIQSIIKKIETFKINSKKDAEEYLSYFYEIENIIKSYENFIKDVYLFNQEYTNEKFDFSKLSFYFSDISKQIFSEKNINKYLDFLVKNSQELLDSDMFEKTDHIFYAGFLSIEIKKYKKLRNFLDLDEHITNIVKKYFVNLLIEKNMNDDILLFIYFIFKTFLYKSLKQTNLVKKDKMFILSVKNNYFFNNFCSNFFSDTIKDINQKKFKKFLIKTAELINMILIEKSIEKKYPDIYEDLLLFVKKILIFQLIPYFVYNVLLRYDQKKYFDLVNSLKREYQNRKEDALIYILNDILSVGVFLKLVSYKERINIIKSFEPVFIKKESLNPFLVSFLFMSDHTGIYSLKYFNKQHIQNFFNILSKSVSARIYILKYIDNTFFGNILIDFDKNVLTLKKLWKILKNMTNVYNQKNLEKSIFFINELFDLEDFIESVYPVDINNLSFNSFNFSDKDNCYNEFTIITGEQIYLIFNIILKDLFDSESFEFKKIKQRITVNVFDGLIKLIEIKKDKEKIIDLLKLLKYRILKKSDIDYIFSLKNRKYSLIILSINIFSLLIFDSLIKSLSDYLKTEEINNFEKNLFEITDNFSYYEYNESVDLKVFLKTFEYYSFLKEDIYFNMIFIRNFLSIGFFYFKTFLTDSTHSILFEEEEAETTVYLNGDKEKSLILKKFFEKMKIYFYNSLFYYINKKTNIYNLYLCLNLLKKDLIIRKGRQIILTEYRGKKNLKKYEIEAVISIYKFLFSIYINGISYVNKEDIENMINLVEIDKNFFTVLNNSNNFSVFKSLFIETGIFPLIYAENKIFIENLLNKYETAEKEINTLYMESLKNLTKIINKANKYLIQKNENKEYFLKDFIIKRISLITSSKAYFSFPSLKNNDKKIKEKIAFGNYVTLKYLYKYNINR
jgi:hypothetical protein